MRILSRSGKALRLALTLWLVFQLLFALPAAAAESGITVRKVETKDYPKVVLTISLAPEPSPEALPKEAFRLRANGKGVENFEVSPIAQTRQPVGIVLALDSSGSMKGKPLFDAKDAARVFIDEMKPQDRIAIIGFSTTPQLLTGFTSDKLALYEALEKIQADGETAFYDALYLALETGAQEKLSQQNIIILSDGRDTRSTHTAAEIVDGAASQDVAIFAFGLTSPEFQEAPLREVSETTSGRFSLVTDSQSLAGFYSQLAKELHNQYQITYTSQAETEKIDLQVEIRTASGLLKEKRTFPNPAPPPKEEKVKKPAPTLQLPSPVENFFKSFWAVPAILGLTFLFSLVLALAALTVFLPRQNVLRDQIKIYEGAYKATHHIQEKEPNGYLGDRPVISQAVNLASSLAEKGGFMQEIQLRVERSGIPLRASEFVFLHICTVVLVGLMALALFDGWLLRLALIPTASAFPLIFLQYLKKRRETLFHQQLPDTLNLIAGALKAGYSFLQAVDMTVQETAPPISSEFKRVLAEARLGLSLEQALDHMADRVQSTNFYWTVMAVKIQREVGGNLAEVLEILADTIRQRDRVYRQVKVLTAEGRLSAIILFLLPLVLGAVLFVLNPQYISALFTTSAGLMLMATAVVLMIVGGIWLRKIVVIEV
jgi:tight adherence protein B